MKHLIRSAIANSPAMNTLMVGILVLGTFCFILMRREVFPEFQLEIVLVSVPYPGASPEEIERGICQKVEEAVQTIDGIQKVTSVAAENAGSVVLELSSSVKDVQRVVSEVRSAIDRIPSFPEMTEDPEVRQITFREPAINLSVIAPDTDGDVDLQELRAVAEQVRLELLALPSVSQAEIKGALDFQIDVELDEDTLRRYGLSLPEVAAIVRRENLELPAGKIKSVGQEILVRSKNKRLTGPEIAELPLVTDPGGVVLSIGDVATVYDGFADGTAITETNGRPSLLIEVQRTASEDLLRITEEVKQYVETAVLPQGYGLQPWGDRSVDVRDRLDMLVSNGRMGLLLVFLVLAVFLELRLAFWVAMGIPISMLGAGCVLLGGGQTLNMLSMFSFLMALGIIVDDAIVVGENIYAHRHMGKTFLLAAVEGTYEVIPSVMASVGTTIIAFCPLLFVSGIMGKFIAVMPLAVIAMLVVSLFESMFILPCHLAHADSLVFRVLRFWFYPLRFVVDFFAEVNRQSARYLARFIDTIYTPVLHWAVFHPWTVLSGAMALLFLAVGVVGGGFVPFNFFPKLDANYLVAAVTFPDGTPSTTTDAATRRMVDAYYEVAGPGVTQVVYRGVGTYENRQGGPGGETTSGSHVGSITVELVESGNRDITSHEIIDRWRAKVGEIPGAESAKYNAMAMGPAGTAIEFKLLADPGSEHLLEQAVEECKDKLKTFAGVYDVDDDSRPGKWELQVSVKDRAKSMGVSSQELANTIRASYYGAEVMRLQRGRHEVKLMVRYPPKERRSLANLDEIRIRTSDGVERPITELAEFKIVRGYHEINRLNQKRSITISADIDESTANARELVRVLQGSVSPLQRFVASLQGQAVVQDAFIPHLLRKYPGLSVDWEGQQEQTRESMGSLFRATGVALVVMFALLTFQFKSYFQPIIILCIIPFGIIGAIIGHAILQLPLTLFSFFGLVALTGVVVNDSIVLIDFINARVRSGVPTDVAVIEAGRRRFRPVLLTSATTVAGLVPILMERSLQAQILVPMAASLAFGLLLATILVLVLVPTMYRIYRLWIPYHAVES